MSGHIDKYHGLYTRCGSGHIISIIHGHIYPLYAVTVTHDSFNTHDSYKTHKILNLYIAKNSEWYKHMNAMYYFMSLCISFFPMVQAQVL